MKRKNCSIVIGAVLASAVLVCMILFVFAGDNSDAGDTTVIPDLTGTWKVAAYVQSGSTVLPEKEFFVFSETKADAFRDNTQKAYASSSFTIENETTYGEYELNFPDIGRKYHMTAVTDNYVRLYESRSVYMELIRYANNDMSDNIISRDIVEDQWIVKYRNAGEDLWEEKLLFVDGILHDYRNGNADPVASVPYYWNDEGHICVDALSAEMVFCPLSENIIMLIEVDTGDIWEIHKDS